MSDPDANELRAEIRRQNDSMQHTINARMEGVLQECDRQFAREARPCAHLSDEQLRGGVVPVDVVVNLLCALNMARQEQVLLSTDEDLRTDMHYGEADELAWRVECIVGNARAAIEAAKGAGE